MAEPRLPPGFGVPKPTVSNMDAMKGMAGSVGVGVPSDQEKTAIAYIEMAADMLEAAADEAPEMAQAVEEIKAFIGETLSGPGEPEQPDIPLPPMMA